MDFIEVNKQFLRLYRKSYHIVDTIVENYLPYLSYITVCFIVKTEKEKYIFLNSSYEKCCHEYLNFIKERHLPDGQRICVFKNEYKNSADENKPCCNSNCNL